MLYPNDYSPDNLINNSIPFNLIPKTMINYSFNDNDTTVCCVGDISTDLFLFCFFECVWCCFSLMINSIDPVLFALSAQFTPTITGRRSDSFEGQRRGWPLLLPPPTRHFSSSHSKQTNKYKQTNKTKRKKKQPKRKKKQPKEKFEKKNHAFKDKTNR